MEINDLIKRMPAYSKTYAGVYRGINKKFFPRWNGWVLLDNRNSLEVVDKEVEEFYKSFYAYRFKLDLLDSVELMEAILSFSTSEGAKKAIQKINKVLEQLNILGRHQNFSLELMEELNKQTKEFTKLLLLEFLEFYAYSNRLSDSYWIFTIYRRV